MFALISIKSSLNGEISRTVLSYLGIHKSVFMLYVSLGKSGLCTLTEVNFNPTVPVVLNMLISFYKQDLAFYNCL